MHTVVSTPRGERISVTDAPNGVTLSLSAPSAPVGLGEVVRPAALTVDMPTAEARTLLRGLAEAIESAETAAAAREEAEHKLAQSEGC